MVDKLAVLANLHQGNTLLDPRGEGQERGIVGGVGREVVGGVGERGSRRGRGEVGSVGREGQKKWLQYSHKGR